jgi:hypothetical protein
MSTTEKVQTFWHGGALSPLAWSCLSSFVHFGHQTVLYTYDEVKAPQGVICKSADRIVTRTALFEWQGLYQPFSNIFRYNLIAKEGGWWIDTDVVCLTSNLPSGDVVFGRELEGEGTIAAGQFKFPKGHPLLDTLIQEASAIGASQREWGEMGPRLFTRVLREANQAERALGSETLYPVHWLEAFRVWLPDRARAIESRLKNACCLHVYNAVLSDLGVDFWAEPPRGSYLDQLYRKYPFHAPLKPLTRDGYRDTLRKIDSYLSQEWVQEYARSYGLNCRRMETRDLSRFGVFLRFFRRHGRV